VVLLLPAAGAGLWVGKRVHVSVTPATMARMIGAALLLTGATLILRTLQIVRPHTRSDSQRVQHAAPAAAPLIARSIHYATF
jgi:uncharacterized membrane protein YfcA